MTITSQMWGPCSGPTCFLPCRSGSTETGHHRCTPGPAGKQQIKILPAAPLCSAARFKREAITHMHTQVHT